MACSNCTTVSYDHAFRMGKNTRAMLEAGYVEMTDHVGYLRRCPVHEMAFAENTRNEELRKTQAELATRVGFTWCEHKCEQEPLLARHPLLTAEQNAELVMQHRERLRVAGFEDMPHHAGLVKRCADCREKSPTFEWIADIPFEAFKQWMDEHDFAFELNEMKVLLPAEPKPEFYFRELPLQTTQPMRAVLLTRIMPEEKPKGGFEFL